MAHPFFDELRSSDLGQNSKFIVPNIFDFSETEITSCKNKSLLKKIIPDSVELFKYIYNFTDK